MGGYFAMESLRKITLVNRSLFMEKCLQWNNRLSNGYYILEAETFNLFQRELGGIDCEKDVNHFLILLGNPFSTIDIFFEELHQEILILALDSFMCDGLMKDLCQ